MSDQQLECISKLILCLEQKNLFITTILDITKQLEIKTQNDEVDFEDLLERRGESMARIDKCKAMEKNVVSTLPPAEQTILLHALQGKPDPTPALAPIIALVNTYDTALNALVISDKVATELLRERYEIVKAKIATNPTHTRSMFNRS